MGGNVLTTTYTGKLVHGKVELSSPIDLPDGSEVYIVTSLTHEPHGPIGEVDVDANTGDVLNDLQTIEAMYARGERFIHST